MTTPLIIQPDTRRAIATLLMTLDACRKEICKRLGPETIAPLFFAYNDLLEKMMRDVGEPIPDDELLFGKLEDIFPE